MISIGIFAGRFGSAALEEKLDSELKDGADFHPIFVRFADQFLPEAKSYERHAGTNAGRRRMAIRAGVLASMHSRADATWKAAGAANFATQAPEGKQICLPKDVPCCLWVAGIFSDGKRPAFSGRGRFLGRV